MTFTVLGPPPHICALICRFSLRGSGHTYIHVRTYIVIFETCVLLKHYRQYSTIIMSSVIEIEMMYELWFGDENYV